VIALAWQTVRARLVNLVGTFVALALGVALLAAMALTLASTAGAAPTGPRWFVRPDVVVAGTGSVAVTIGAGEDADTETTRTAASRTVPAAVAARLSTLEATTPDATTPDATAVVDYAGYAMTTGAPGDTAHPWSAAAMHDYHWVAGGRPTGNDEIVLTAPTKHRPGDRITVQTIEGPERFTVSGVLRTDAPAAFYTTDQVAQRLAGNRIDAIALTARPTGTDRAGTADGGGRAAALAGQVRAALGGTAGMRILTGDHRRDVEPDPDADKLEVAASLLGTTSGLAAFVSIFVVAGTFSYSVAARRREFGLLRMAGATPRQVRRLVLGEALVSGTLAALAGGALGTLLAPVLAGWLARSGFAPAGFTAHFILWPVAAAFGTGLLVAVLGAALAARRAGRVRPVEALREASVDRRPMTLTRWLFGLAAAGGAVPILAVFATMHSADASALILVLAMLLVIAGASFAPLVIPPLVWLLTAPLAASRGALGVLARRGARASVRRTAATAAPILVTIGIAGALLAGTETLNGAAASAARAGITADAVVAPGAGTGDQAGGGPAGAGLADRTVAALRGQPGVRAAVPVTDAPVYVRQNGEPEDWTGRYANGPDLAGVLHLPVVAGDLADLTGTDTVAVPAGRWRLGQTADLWLGDSTPVRLRVVAVLGDRLDLDQTVLLPLALRAGHARPLADTVYLRLAPGTGLAGPAATAAAGGGTLVRTADYLSAADGEQQRTNQLAMTAVLGMALLYTGISIANTLVMATGNRRRELATLRLTGATTGQLLRLVLLEAVLVTCAGTLLAALVTGITVVGMRHSLAGLAPSTGIVVPWSALGAITLACLVTAVLASVLPAGLLLRRRPVELAAVPE
jgi:putative ABC transport system permease protein